MRLLVLLAACTGTSPDPDSALPGDSAAPIDGGADNLGGDTSDTGGQDTSEEPDATGDDAADEAAYLAFYEANVITQVTLELSAADEAAMNAEVEAALAAGDADPEFTYFPAAITLNGERIENVGVRVKGGATVQSWNDKPSIKVKFDAFDEGTQFAGLKRITLENMAEDPAMCREVLGFHAWREAGMPAPAANFAQVYLSVEGVTAAYYGLYTNLEAMDSRWVSRAFADDGGDLWEAQDSADLTDRGLGHFSLVTGEGDAAALDHARDQLQNHEGDFYSAADDVLDMDAFLQFWTMSLAIGNRDGYPFHLNDFFVYLDPTDDRFEFVPASMGEGFDSGTPVYGRYVVGSVGQLCAYYDDACAERYVAALGTAIADVEGSDLATFAAAAQVLTDVAVQDDARKSWNGEAITTAQVEAARETLNARIVAYPGLLRVGLGL